MNEIGTYFAKTGLVFLPDDYRYLSELLEGMGSTRRKDYLKQYHLVWLKGMQAEPINIKKQNKGRFAANVWIRELILDEKRWAA